MYVWLNNPDLCIERIKVRVRSGGHFVEDDVVRRRYERSLKNLFGLYRPLADAWQVYDNSDRGNPVLVAEGHRADMASIHVRVTWDEMMRRASP